MKVVSLRDAKAGLSAFVELAQSERILVTRHGKPAALLIGVADVALEDLLTMANPRFWALIEASRAGKTFSIEEARKRLGGDSGEKRRRAGAARRRSKRR